MKFNLSHDFSADLATVEQASLSPDLFIFMKNELTEVVQEIELLEQLEEGDTVLRKVRYLPHPIIRKVGNREIPPHYMEWVENSTYDRRRRIMTFQNIPTSGRVAELFSNEGTFRLEAVAGGGTRRIVEGNVKIDVPLLGRLAERLIYSHAVRILDEEAKAFQKFIQYFQSR